MIPATDDEAPAPAPVPVRPPGPMVTVLTLVSVVLLLCVYYDLWPRGQNMEFVHKLLITAPALLLLGLGGLLWLIRTLLYVTRGRRWSWWLAVAPGVVSAAALVVVLFPRPDFDDLRPEFEQVAREVLAHPGSTRGNLEIGGIEIAHVEHREDGGVYFTDADNSVASQVGWIYSPDRIPDDGGRVFLSLDHIGGPWYTFEYGT